MDQRPVILAQMTQKERPAWPLEQKHTGKRLLRNKSFFAAVSLCLGVCTLFFAAQPEKAEMVMSHLSTGFEYDETLGRLQLVSNLLPQSAMVFLSTDSSAEEFQSPTGSAQISHSWTMQEPWLEYACIGDVTACQAGEIVAIVKNHAGSHTVRILHEDGYESIYSGLHTMHAKENEIVACGQVIGTSVGSAAFELRREGVSVLPVFAQGQ